MRRLAMAALALALAAVPAAAADRTAVALGFRGDAPPFSYLEGGRYRGFIAELCERLFPETSFAVQRSEIDPASRAAFLNGAPGAVDVLCDPVTLSLARSERVWFSPILFAAGTTYIERVGSDRSTIDVGFLAGTTARRAVDMARGDALFSAAQVKVMREHPVASHSEGMDRLCDGAIDFYFGDRDILLALHRQRGPECRAVLSRLFFTYEPYALAIRRDRPDLAFAVQGRLYRLFAEGVLDTLFAMHFPDKPQSDLLKTLFFLNRVEPLTP